MNSVKFTGRIYGWKNKKILAEAHQSNSVGGKEVVFNKGLKQLDIQWYRKESPRLPHIIQKINFRMIIDLNMKAKTIKLLE